jgi:hypothetical protein
MSFFKPTRMELLNEYLAMGKEDRPPESKEHKCQWAELPSVSWSHPDVRTLVCMVPGCNKVWEMNLRLLDEEGDRL